MLVERRMKSAFGYRMPVTKPQIRISPQSKKILDGNPVIGSILSENFFFK